MRKLYKEGKECMADNEQVAFMEKAGWATSPTVVEEVVASEPEVEKDVEETVEEAPAKPKVIPKRKVIKKKTDSEE